MKRCKDACSLKLCRYVPQHTPTTSQLPVLLIGQAPGKVEGLTKTPFTGLTGKMLKGLLLDIGLDLHSLYINNIVSCAPPEDRIPTPSEIAACFEGLRYDIKQAKPKLIVALGEVAAYALTDKRGIKNIRGQKFPLLAKYNYKCEVLCLLHPSFLIRQRQWIELAKQDLKGINNHFFPTTLTQVSTPKEPTFIYDPSPSELAEHFNNMSQHITSVDIETPGELNIRKASIIGIAFSASRDLAIGLDFTNPSAISDETWQVMKKFLEDPKAQKSMQNAFFDVGVLRSNGVDTKGLTYDTLLAEHTMYSDMPGNLDFLRGKYTDVPQYKPSKAKMKTIGSWGKEERLCMNCWDVIATHEVRLAQLKIMDKGQLDLLKNIELPLIDVCDSLERKGIRIDVNRLAILYKKLQPQADLIEKTHFSPLGINPRSPKQLIKHFGIKSTDEKTLKYLIRRNKGDVKLMQTLLDYRKLLKITSVYLKGVYDRMDEGRIHAHPNSAGTGTGRFSYKNPNLQNVPDPLRIIYTPDDEDHVFIKGDYNQMEVRVAAVLSQEETMLKDLAEGRSIHQLMGKDIFHKEWNELTPKQQLRVKTVVFGTLYGRGSRSIAIEFNVPTSLAEQWQKIYVDKYPKVNAYLQKQTKNFYSTGRCITPFGRVRVLQTLTQAYNAPIQSSAADVLKVQLIKLYKEGFDLRVTVHDDIVAQADRKISMEVLREFKKVMESPVELLNGYVFPIKAKIGDNWFQMKEVKF